MHCSSRCKCFAALCIKNRAKIKRNNTYAIHHHYHSPWWKQQSANCSYYSCLMRFFILVWLHFLISVTALRRQRRRLQQQQQFWLSLAYIGYAAHTCALLESEHMENPIEYFSQFFSASIALNEIYEIFFSHLTNNKRKWDERKNRKKKKMIFHVFFRCVISQPVERRIMQKTSGESEKSNRIIKHKVKE